MRAVVTGIALHGLVLAAGGAATLVAILWPAAAPFLPREPLLVVAVGLIMAHTSLGAIWWSRTGWPLPVRTLVAVVSCTVMWVLMLELLDTARATGPAAASWAACLAVQAAAVAVAGLAIEAVRDWPATAARHRFSLAFLIAVMTGVAIALGALGWIAQAGGWRIADVSGWEYFWQLQAVAGLNMLLATLVLVGLRLRCFAISPWIIALGAVAVLTVLMPSCLRALFGDKAGATRVDLAWLAASEGLFLLAALGPSEMLTGGRLQSAEHPGSEA
jgi:hypothetical protein